MNCLRCDTVMQDCGQQEFQLGKQSFLFGDLSNLLSGSFLAQLYVCPKCGKIEFFRANDNDTLSFSERLKRDNSEDK